MITSAEAAEGTEIVGACDEAHKLHLASDRTSCTKATANQFRLLVHTAAYWLMLTLRGLAPKPSFWRDVQFDTIRITLLKVAAASQRWLRVSRWRCRSPILTSKAGCCSPSAQFVARLDRGGIVPIELSVPPTLTPHILDLTAPTAPPRRTP